ncbi:MAG: hypothetical protein AAF623_04545 [Planctomycetota bacterium]
MRLTLAILITIFLIGGTYAYIEFADSVIRPPVEVQVNYANGTYSVDIERTFDCESFLDEKGLQVKFKGNVVYESPDQLPAEAALTIESLDGVEVGPNEIFVSANLPMTAMELAVLKVVVRRDGIVMAEQLLASEPGLGTVRGTVLFTIPSRDPQTSTHSH